MDAVVPLILSINDGNDVGKLELFGQDERLDVVNVTCLVGWRGGQRIIAWRIRQYDQERSYTLDYIQYNTAIIGGRVTLHNFATCTCRRHYGRKIAS